MATVLVPLRMHRSLGRDLTYPSVISKGEVRFAK